MPWYLGWKWPLLIWALLSAGGSLALGQLLKHRSRDLPYHSLPKRMGYVEPSRREAVPEDFQ